MPVHHSRDRGPVTGSRYTALRKTPGSRDCITLTSRRHSLIGEFGDYCELTCSFGSVIKP